MLVFSSIILAAGWYCNLNSHPQVSVPHPPVDTAATQWHKRILSDSSSELEDQTASSYQGCISKASARKWIGYFPSERLWASFNFHRWTSLGVSLSEAYPTQYCCNLRARHPQVRVQIRRQAEALQPPRDLIPRQVEAGRPPKNWVPRQAEACRLPGTPGLGGSLSRLRHDNLSRTRSLGRSRQVDLLGPLDWSWASPRSPV